MEKETPSPSQKEKEKEKKRKIDRPKIMKKKIFNTKMTINFETRNSLEIN